MNAARILVVDDHPIVREGLVRLLSAEADLEVVGAIGAYQEALEAVPSLRPDLAIIDISLGGQSGLDLIEQLASVAQGIRILVLSMHSEIDLAPRALRSGAHGYIMKSEAAESLISAIRKVLNGEIYVSAAVNRKLLEAVKSGEEDPLGRLTDRELEVLKLMGAGKTTREIGKHLGISIKTVETHRAHIRDKLGVRANSELVARAARWIERGEF